MITNNPEVYKLYENSYPMKFSQGGYHDVLIEVRDLVHQGCELISHPLMGSVKPNETPYRSIILKQGSQTDLQSVEIIESSIQTYEKFKKMKSLPMWSHKILEDFQFVDLKLFESAIESTNLHT
ncbi:MAG: GrdX protein [Clostridia bacterium]|nr:GrdX protein [Clostridia bacterium]